MSFNCTDLRHFRCHTSSPQNRECDVHSARADIAKAQMAWHCWHAPARLVCDGVLPYAVVSRKKVAGAHTHTCMRSPSKTETVQIANYNSELPEMQFWEAMILYHPLFQQLQLPVNLVGGKEVGKERYSLQNRSCVVVSSEHLPSARLNKESSWAL